MCDAVSDDGVQFVVVDATLDGGDQGNGQPRLGAAVQGPAFDVAQVSSTDVEMGLGIEAVELEVDVDRTARAIAVAEFGNEAWVGCQPNPVGIEVDCFDRPSLRCVDDLVTVLLWIDHAIHALHSVNPCSRT